MKPLREANEEGNPQLRWWMWPTLWGLEFPLLAMLWFYVFASIQGINMITMETPMLFAVACWIIGFSHRFYNSIKGLRDKLFSHVYSTHLAPLIGLIFCALMALIWMILFAVGAKLLYFTLFPTIFLLFSLLRFRLKFWKACALFFNALSFATACAGMAFYFAIVYYPMDVILDPSVWLLALLLFLFRLERASWSAEKAESKASLSLIVTIGLFLSLALCLGFAHNAPDYAKGIYYTLIIACAFIEVLSRLKNTVSLSTLRVISWWLMVLAPLAGISLFLRHWPI